MTPVSAVLITFNEERRLADALASVRFCSEIVVVDSGSTDRTRAIAEQAGARVVVREPWPGFSEQRNFAMAQAANDWVLFVDADERISPALRADIEAERARGLSGDAYRMPRVTSYLGRWIRATDWYPDTQTRLIDRRRARWEGEVHEAVRVGGRIRRLRGEIEHHPYETLSDHVQRIDRYTTLWAREAFAGGRRATPLDVVLHPAWAFLRNYILRGGVWLGGAGLTLSLMNTFYVFAKRAKLAELCRRAR